jgi:hypothetical protein
MCVSTRARLLPEAIVRRQAAQFRPIIQTIKLE